MNDTLKNPTSNALSNPPLRVIFAGTPAFSAVSLQALIDQQSALNIEIVAVYTQPDRKAGRGQKLSESAVKQLAQRYDIPVQQPETFRLSTETGRVSRETLESYQADVMVVVAYGLILPLGVLNTPRLGCLNIHASLLPRWRGAAPIHRALLAGDTQTGITIMQMNQGLDTGDMLYQVATDILPEDTSASLHDRLADLGAQAICVVLQDLPHFQQNAQVQEDALATYAEKLSKQEGEIDWHNSAPKIERQIRGMTPFPSSFTFLRGKRVKVLQTLPFNPSQSSDQPAGTVISVGKNAILVACGDGTSLRLTQLQFEGGKPLHAEQICQGNQIQDGDRFGD